MEEQINEEVKCQKKERKRKFYEKLVVATCVLNVILFFAFSRIDLFMQYGKEVLEIKSKLYTLEDIEYININNNDKANKVVLNNINIYLPDEFKLDIDESNEYCEVYKKNDNIITYDAGIKICDNYGLYLRESGIEDDDEFKEIMMKNNLNNTIDILKYYVDNIEYEPAFFDKENDLKLNYYVRNYTDNTIIEYDKFYFLEHDVNGIYYVHEDKENRVKNINRAFIKYNDKFYIINFENSNESYFNIDNIFDIISSIKSKK